MRVRARERGAEVAAQATTLLTVRLCVALGAPPGAQLHGARFERARASSRPAALCAEAASRQAARGGAGHCAGAAQLVAVCLCRHAGVGACEGENGRGEEHGARRHRAYSEARRTSSPPLSKTWRFAISSDQLPCFSYSRSDRRWRCPASRTTPTTRQSRSARSGAPTQTTAATASARSLPWPQTQACRPQTSRNAHASPFSCRVARSARSRARPRWRPTCTRSAARSGVRRASTARCGARAQTPTRSYPHTRTRRSRGLPSPPRNMCTDARLRWRPRAASAPPARSARGTTRSARAPPPRPTTSATRAARAGATPSRSTARPASALVARNAARRRPCPARATTPTTSARPCARAGARAPSTARRRTLARASVELAPSALSARAGA